MKKIKAFTLIETLIVIVVFCIGILVVLQWLSQTLRNKDYASTQIKSAFLAREWIELLFNLRDANYHKELPWNCIFKHNSDPTQVDVDEDGDKDISLFCDWMFIPWTVLKIWIWTNSGYVYAETGSLYWLDFDEIFSGYQIYFHTWNALNGETWFKYDYTWTEDEKTWFARYLLITWVVADWWIVDDEKLLKVESHVLVQKWALTWEKVMETFIWNYEFNQ